MTDKEFMDHLEFLLKYDYKVVRHHHRRVTVTDRDGKEHVITILKEK